MKVQGRKDRDALGSVFVGLNKSTVTVDFSPKPIALTLVVKADVAVRRRRQDAADEQRNKVG